MSEPETVEWHTWSGRRHKFGSLIRYSTGWGDRFYRRAQCNSSIVTDALTQSAVKEIAVCKRCFPERG